MKELMQKLRESATEAIEKAEDVDAIEALRVKYLGKKGELTAILKQMGRLSEEERPAMGQLANQLRSEIENGLDERKKALSEKLLDMKLDEQVDLASGLSQIGARAGEAERSPGGSSPPPDRVRRPRPWPGRCRSGRRVCPGGRSRSRS